MFAFFYFPACCCFVICFLSSSFPRSTSRRFFFFAPPFHLKRSIWSGYVQWWGTRGEYKRKLRLAAVLRKKKGRMRYRSAAECLHLDSSTLFITNAISIHLVAYTCVSSSIWSILRLSRNKKTKDFWYCIVEMAASPVFIFFLNPPLSSSQERISPLLRMLCCQKKKI